MVVILDFNRTLYDPVAHTLFAGAEKLLKKLKQSKINIVLYSTESETRRLLIEELGLREYFNGVVFVKNKTADDLAEIIKQFNSIDNEIVIVGDNPEGELSLGVSLGLKTIAVGTGFCTPQDAKKLGIDYFPSIMEATDQLIGAENE